MASSADFAGGLWGRPPHNVASLSAASSQPNLGRGVSHYLGQQHGSAMPMPPPSYQTSGSGSSYHGLKEHSAPKDIELHERRQQALEEAVRGGQKGGSPGLGSSGSSGKMKTSRL